MKFLESVLFIMAVAPGCNPQTNVLIKQFIPGSYVRMVHNEFSKGRDTLIIRELGTTQYSIEHLMTYQRIAEGKPKAIERKAEHWMALYDENEEVLKETKRGRIISFQPEENTLMVGSSTYQKIR